MLRALIPLFILALPLAEIAAFIVVGRQIGLFPTLSLVLLSAVAGIVLMRIQGFGAVARLRQAGRDGRVPGKELFDTAMIMIAGVLLLIPGFISDLIGLALLLPPVRQLLGHRLLRNFVVVDIGGQRPGGRPQTGPERTIDLDENDFHRGDRP